MLSLVTWSARLQAEAGHGDVLSAVSGLKVRSVRLVLGLRYERHLLVLEVVPVQTLKQGVILQFWGRKATLGKHLCNRQNKESLRAE